MHLSFSVPIAGTPEGFLLRLDGLIFIFAVLGLASTWNQDRFIAVWLLVDLLLLLGWRTKWPQYVLVATVPLSFAAAEGIKTTARNAADWWRSRPRVRDDALKPSHKDVRRALPWLLAGTLAFVLLTILPLLFQVAISMTDLSITSLRDGFNGGIWRALSGGLTGTEPVIPLDIRTQGNRVHFTGLSAYPLVFQWITGSYSGWNILFFDTMWTVLSVILQGALGLAVALLLWQRGVKLGKFWQALFILPWAIPEMIGALMWMNIFLPEDGWLALAVAKYGENIPFAFFNGWERSPDIWLAVYLLAAVWYGFPFMMLASSVGLKAIQPDVLDAATIDGAAPWQTFRYVTWPLLLPLVVPAIIVRGIFSFNQFYLFQVFYFTDSTLATFSYNIFNPVGGFGGPQGQFAISAVVNIITVIILMILLILFNRWSKASEGVTYA
jgi:arabinogalactan oligomer/maltooligosaccharide transport system permease protein